MLVPKGLLEFAVGPQPARRGAQRAWCSSARLVQGLGLCPWEVGESRLRGPHAPNWPHRGDAHRDPMEMMQVHRFMSRGQG